MAAKYAFENEGAIQGLALMAAYPPSGSDLSDRAISATSIFATLDGVANAERFQDSGSFTSATKVSTEDLLARFSNQIVRRPLSQ